MAEPDGAFEIQLSADDLGRTKPKGSRKFRLVFQVENQPAYVIEISPEIVESVLRDLEG